MSEDGTSKPPRWGRYTGVALVAALATLSLASLYVRFERARFMPIEYPMWDYAWRQAGQPHEPAADLLILGDSRAKAALVPDLLGESALSLALGGVTAIETVRLLEDYLAHHPAPRAIVVSFAPLHLAEVDSFWGRTVKFGLVPADAISAAFERAERQGSNLFGDPATNRLRWLPYRLFAAPLYFPELATGYLFLRGPENARIYGEIERARGHFLFGRAPGSEEASQETQRDGFEASPLLDAYLHDLLDRASAASPVVLYRTMPLNEASAAALAPNFRSQLAAYLGSVARRHPRVDVDTRLPVLPNRYIGDALGHVNASGAERVSRDLARDLRARIEDARLGGAGRDG